MAGLICIVKQKIDKGEHKDYKAVSPLALKVLNGSRPVLKQCSRSNVSVEYEDGTVHECYPGEIRFLDSKVKDYLIAERTDKNKDKFTSTKDTPALAGNFPNLKNIFK